MKHTVLAAVILLLGGSPGLFAAEAKQLTASNPSLQGRMLTLDIESPAGGWAVVYEMRNGKRGRDVGHALVEKGRNDGVRMELSLVPRLGESLLVMLHGDQGAKGVFEYGPRLEIDVPLTHEGQRFSAIVTP